MSNYTQLGFVKQTDGENTGTWGDVLNENLIDLLDDSIGGYVEVSVASGNVTLAFADGTADNNGRHSTIKFTGSPGTTRTVTFPDAQVNYFIINGSDSSVICTSGSGVATVTIPTGMKDVIYIDGSDEILSMFGTPNLSSSGNFTVDATTDIILDADGGDIFFKDGGTTFGSATNTSGNLIIKSGTTAALTFSGANVTAEGNLTVDGDLDVTGTLDLSDSNFTNVGSLQLDSIAGDGDTNTSITFSGSDIITIATGGAGRLTIGDGALSPVTNNQIDLGTSSLEFKDAFFDGTVTADAFAGPLTGNVTGNASGTAAIATTVTITDNESTNESNAIIFTAGGDVDGGNLGLESDGTLTYNPSTGKITATGFIGTLTGNVTGNVTGNASGTAATVTTAAQSSITSLGTLTTLTVDNVIINGSTIGHTGDTDLITVASDIVTVAGEVSMTTLDIGGTNVTSDAGELNTLDGITAVVGELNALDIGSTAIGTAVASKAVILDSNKDYTGLRNFTVSGELDAATGDFSGDVDVDGTLEADAITINGTAIASVLSPIAGGSGIVTTGALNSGSITSGFGTIDTGSSTITTTGLISGGSLDIDNVLINGTTIGHTDDTDLITVADGLVTVAGEVQMTTLDIGGTNVSATAAEINYLDLATLGTTAASKVFTADSNNVTAISGAVVLTEDTLSFDATQDWDVRASPNAKVTLTANVTFDAPSNPTTGQYIAILCIQDGTGSRTIAWNAVFEFTGDETPTATTTAAKGDLFTFRYNGAKWLEVGRNFNLTLS